MTSLDCFFLSDVIELDTYAWKISSKSLRHTRSDVFREHTLFMVGGSVQMGDGPLGGGGLSYPWHTKGVSHPYTKIGEETPPG